ncbi:MAG TPA: hypothetical protein IAC38_04145 [Candidatus Caccovivens faecavium]|nr:hypothetical protein [Candidatus Caccovivens faecavium]
MANKKDKVNGWKVACISLASLAVIGGAVWGGFAINDAVKANQSQEEEEVQTPETPTDEEQGTENEGELEVGGATITNYAELCEAYM